MAVHNCSFLPCSWNRCILCSFKVRLELEAAALIVHRSDIVNMKSDERWRRLPAINPKPNAPNPKPVTALQGLRWSMSFQPFAGTMLLLKNATRHRFAYFLQWKLAVWPKVPRGYEKFDLYHDRLNEGETKPQRTPTNAITGREENLLGDPGNQRLRLEDHLVGVAALDRLSINEAAESQIVRIWGWNDPCHCLLVCSAPGPPPPPWSFIIIHLDHIQRLKLTTHRTRDADEWPTPRSLTFDRVGGHQRGAERTEAVEGFSQQPLLPVALHLPVAGADVVGDRETGDVGEGVFLLRGENGKTAALPPSQERVRGRAAMPTLMCFPLRPITNANSTSQSTSFNERKQRAHRYPGNTPHGSWSGGVWQLCGAV